MQALSVLQVAGSKKSQPAIDRERRSSGFLRWLIVICYVAVLLIFLVNRPQVLIP